MSPSGLVVVLVFLTHPPEAAHVNSVSTLFIIAVGLPIEGMPLGDNLAWLSTVLD